MIETVLATLATYGVTDAVLSLGYLPERFTAAYPTNVIGGVRVTYAVEPEPLDTAGAIRFAASTAHLDETFVVVNGDVLSDLDLSKLLAFHRERRAQATIALTPVEDPSRYGVVAVNEEGRVLAFVEKPPKDQAPSNLINAGIYLFEPSVVDQIDATRPVSVEREIFPELVRQGTLFALADEAYWLDTGTPHTYLRANVDVLRGARPEGHFAGIVDGSWRHPSATIDPTAKVTNSVVDQNCVVGALVVLEDAVLLPGAVVQSECVIRSSIIGPEAVIGSGSVLGPTCVVGANEHVASASQLSGDVRLGGV